MEILTHPFVVFLLLAGHVFWLLGLEKKKPEEKKESGPTHSLKGVKGWAPALWLAKYAKADCADLGTWQFSVGKWWKSPSGSGVTNIVELDQLQNFLLNLSVIPKGAVQKVNGWTVEERAWLINAHKQIKSCAWAVGKPPAPWEFTEDAETKPLNGSGESQVSA